MAKITKPKGYWTKERLLEMAHYNSSIADFRKHNPTAYKIACAHGWKDDVRQHIETQHQQYTKEECRIEAMKYNNKEDFKNNSPLHYMWAKNHRYLTEICSHMNNRGNRRHVYVFEFEDRHAYIGLSLYPYKRERQHLNEERSVVSKYIRETGAKYAFKVLTESPSDDPIQQEIHWIKKYKSDGWILLNKELDEVAADGSPKYSLEYCTRIARRYLRRQDFQKNNTMVFNFANRHQLLDSICQHMDDSAHEKQHWTKERCQEEANKYKTRKDFQKECRGAYAAAYRNKWLDEICVHMERPTPHNLYWTAERCAEEALKYMTRRDFQEASPGAYNAAKKNGLLDTICSHMTRTSKPAGYWTKARCIREVKRYKSISDFRKKCPSAFNIAWRNGWLDELRDKMK